MSDIVRTNGKRSGLFGRTRLLDSVRDRHSDHNDHDDDEKDLSKLGHLEVE